MNATETAKLIERIAALEARVKELEDAITSPAPKRRKKAA